MRVLEMHSPFDPYNASRARLPDYFFACSFNSATERFSSMR